MRTAYVSARVRDRAPLTEDFLIANALGRRWRYSLAEAVVSYTERVAQRFETRSRCLSPERPTAVCQTSVVRPPCDTVLVGGEDGRVQRRPGYETLRRIWYERLVRQHGREK
jgi:hypothetical protein